MVKKRSGIEYDLPKPWGQMMRLRHVGLGRDAKGYFVHTHRARSKSYVTVAAIPDKVVKYIESTG